MAQWLRAREIDEAEIAEALARLSESGAIDDRRFAVGFAEDKRELAGWGSQRIREALLGRGVGAEHVDAALGADEPRAELDRAVAVLARRAAPLADDADRGRALRLLIGRGYPLETAQEAVHARERELSRREPASAWREDAVDCG